MTGEIKPRYTGVVKVTGGRQGQAISDDGVLDLPLRLPKLRGQTDGTNPEQLFAAAWGGCLLGVLAAITRGTGVDVSHASVHVEVDVGADTVDGGNGIAARISLAIPGMELAEVQSLADQAHAACPYSKATRGNIPVTIIAVPA